MPENTQLTLDLNKTILDDYNPHDFVVLDEHKDAHDLLEKFCSQESYDLAKLPALILLGEEFSGKTHLLNIFANKFGFEIFSSKEVREVEPISLFTGQKILAIDDADELKDDNLLFHIYNLALENKVFLLLSMKNTEVFKLKDLVSRLRNILRTQIKDPDIDLIKILLSKGFSKKQLKIDAKIIDYLALNIERKYSKIEKIINKIEKFAFENKKKISLVDVKKMV